MTETTRSPLHPPMHPGELLREEIIPAMDLSVTEIAKRLGVSRQALHDILNESARVSPEMALRLGKLFGNGARFWANLQLTYDLETAGQKMMAEIDQIETIKAA